MALPELLRFSDSEKALVGILPVQTSAGAGSAEKVVALDANGLIDTSMYTLFAEGAKGAVPGPTAADISNNRVLQADGTWVTPSAGGGDPDQNLFETFTDGTTSAVADSTTDTFKFRSANNLLTVAVGSDDATHGDNLLLTVNEGNIDHDALTNFVANEHLDWTSDQGATDIHAGNITEAAVTQHQAALSITESQISDLGNYLDQGETALQTMLGPLEIRRSNAELLRFDIGSIADRKEWHYIGDLNGVLRFKPVDTIDPAETFQITDKDSNILAEYDVNNGVGIGGASESGFPLKVTGDFKVTGNITGNIAESQITDGAILARLAADEPVTGAWTFSKALTVMDHLQESERKQLTDDESHAFTKVPIAPAGSTGTYPLFILLTRSNNQARQGIFFTSLTGQHDIGSGSAFDFGGNANNDTDGKINVWSDGAYINVKNRLGSTLQYMLKRIGGL